MHLLQAAPCDIDFVTTALTMEKIFIPHAVCKSLRIDL